jgi:hypothetical protein
VLTLYPKRSIDFDNLLQFIQQLQEAMMLGLAGRGWVGHIGHEQLIGIGGNTFAHERAARVYTAIRDHAHAMSPTLIWIKACLAGAA